MKHRETLLLILLSLLTVGSLSALVYLADNPGPAQQDSTSVVERIADRVDVGPDQAQDAAIQFGYTPDPEGTQKFLRELPKPTLREAAPNLFQARGPPQDVFLYRALFSAYKSTSGQDWRVGKQGIGDCVSWGWAHGCDIELAVRFELGEVGEWKPAATESIYGGSRVEARGRTSGGYSDGSYGAAAAKWVRDWGVVHRQDYPGLADLSVYSASRAKQWGNFGNGGQGDDGRLDTVAKQHPAKHVALVTNFEEAAAAIESGYPIPVCSGQGFASTRDSDGFARPQGSWAHCMCFVGVRYGERPGLLCLNSWGPTWINGPKYPSDQPDGSFWVDKATVSRMLSGRDSFAVGSVDGFKFRDLRHGDWVRLDRPQPAHESVLALAP